MAGRNPQRPSSEPSLSPKTALGLLRQQKGKAMKLVEERRFLEEDIEPWRIHTVNLLDQALGSNSAALYHAAFYNWQTHSYDEDEEAEYADDVQKALPRAVNTLTQVIEYLETIALDTKKETKDEDLWSGLHPKITEIAQPRFESKHFADAVEASLKEANDRVKSLVKARTGKEYDGADLMRKAFSPNAPIISLADMSTTSGQNEQQGYMEIFAGAMTGIRNPKAHSNLVIDEKRTMHLLYLASLLMYKLDEAK